MILILSALGLYGCTRSTTEPFLEQDVESRLQVEPYKSLHLSNLKGWLVQSDRKNACLVESLWISSRSQMSLNGYVKWDVCCVPTDEPGSCPSIPLTQASTGVRNIDSEFTLQIEADSPLNLIVNGQMARQSSVSGTGRITTSSVFLEFQGQGENFSLNLTR